MSPTSALTDLMEIVLTEQYDACVCDCDRQEFFSKFCISDKESEHPNWCWRKMREVIADTMDCFGAHGLPQQFFQAIQQDIDEGYLLTVVIEWHEKWMEETREAVEDIKENESNQDVDVLA